MARPRKTQPLKVKNCAKYTTLVNQVSRMEISVLPFGLSCPSLHVGKIHVMPLRW